MAVEARRISGSSEAPTSLTGSPSAHHASPQIEEVITTSEGRIGLLGDWREVPPPPQFGSAVVFVLMTALSFLLYDCHNVVTDDGQVDKIRLITP